MNIQIISETQIRHPAGTSAVVVTLEQVIEIDGQRFLARHWHHFATGRLHHVDSNPIAKA
jgi:hypothetical protein